MKDLLRTLETNELTDFCGGGYWCTEMVDGKVVTYWVSC